MTIQFINTGSSPNAGNGDPLRIAFNKINYNFNQLNTGSLGAALVQSATPPVGYGTSTIWYDTVSGRSYIYYQGSWVDASPNLSLGGGGGGGSVSTGTSTLSVGLIDSFTLVTSNTVTNVNSILFDTESAFTVDQYGQGQVIVGMNSTFKFIKVAHESTLTAVGLDTLTFIAGPGIALVTDATPGNQSIEIINTATAKSLLPSTSTAGLLYDDGAGNFSWVDPVYSALVNGTSTFLLNTDGSVIFNDGSVQSTAYVVPVEANNNRFQEVVTVNTLSALQVYPTVTINPYQGILALNKLQFADSTQQTTAWLGHVSSLTNGTWTVGLSTSGVLSIPLELLFPDTSVQTTAWTGFVDYSRITNAPQIPPLTTSTLYNGSYRATLTNVGSFVVPTEVDVQFNGTTDLILAGKSTGGLIQSPISNNDIRIQTTSSSQTYTWRFNPNGSITWPDGSVQASANTATSLAATATNYINNGIEKLSVLADGEIQFPDGSKQTSAFVGVAYTATLASYLLNNGHELRPVAVPSNLTGSIGDLAGDIAADSNYFYYCFGSFTTTVYTVVSVDTGAAVYHIDIAQGNYPQPQIGWIIQDPVGGPAQTITSVASGTYNGTPYWRLNEGTFSNTYVPGLNFYLTNTSVPTPGWGKIAWAASGANVGTNLIKSSGFVNLNSSVSLDNISVQWAGSAGNVQLAVSSISGTFDGTYNLVTNYNQAVIAVNGSNITFSTVATLLGPTSNTEGDLATLVITVPGNPNAYRITGLIGTGFTNNLISIERLV